MRKDLRLLLIGTFAGLVLGVLVTLRIQHRQQSARSTVAAVVANHDGRTPLEGSGLSTPKQSGQAWGGDETNTGDSVTSSSDGVTAIRITPACSITFSAPFAKAMQELKAAGEPPDVLVNIVVAEFNRQRRDLANAVNRKLRSGELEPEESQEFFHSRNEPIGQAITQLLGENSFRYWDKH